MKNFQIYSSINECFNHSKLLQSAVNFGIISTQSQKMTAEPENSKNKTLANTSTPLKNRAFFVRSTHTLLKKFGFCFQSENLYFPQW